MIPDARGSRLTSVQARQRPASPVEQEDSEDGQVDGFKDPMIDSDGSGSESGSDEGEDVGSDGSGEEEVQAAEAASKPKERKKANAKSLFKPPTNAELMELRTGGERGGTGFALQVSRSTAG